jgi:long-chain acyl-CoA synthetase
VADVASAKSYPAPSPTVLFIHPRHLTRLTSSILKEARKSRLLYSFAWRHKVAGLREGFVTKESMWDHLLFDAARAKVVGEGAGTIRVTVISGGDATFCLPLSVI